MDIAARVAVATAIAGYTIAAPMRAPLAAQEPPPRQLPAVTEEHPEGVSSVSGLVELADGRVLVSDSREVTLRLLSFDDGAVRTPARPGRGPREYVSAGGLYRQRNGEVWLLDAVQRRYLALSATGAPLRTESFVQAHTGGFSFSAGRDPHALDGRGAEYERLRPLGAGASLDSSALVRRSTAGVDTIAWLRNPVMSANSALGASIITVQRFSPSDGFAVSESGDVAIVRADPYRVEWLSRAGAVRRGPVLAYVSVPVTQADRDSATNASRDAAQSMNLPRITQQGADGVTRTVDIGALRASVPLATTKPSLDPQRVYVDRAGLLWVGRHGANGTPAVYDVFDATGARVDRVQLPPATALVGFGNGRIYVAREDEDGLKFIGRIPYALPQ